MRIFLITVVTVFTCSVAAHAEKLVSPSGGQYVLVFKTKDTMDYFARECAGKGNRALAQDCFSCVKAMADSGTPCSVIEKTITSRKVRIMAGAHKGKVGWAPFEMVQ